MRRVPHSFAAFGERVGYHRPVPLRSLPTGVPRVYTASMTRGLYRIYGDHDLHFITCSCYHRQPVLAAPRRRDLLLDIMEEVRQAYQFVVVGYVVMPEHFHLLISEPDIGDPSTVMKVLKMRFARHLHKDESHSFAYNAKEWGTPLELVWQKRFYDFNVRSDKKRIEKLKYMHRNPLRRGLVSDPEQWPWSSFRSYLYGETGRVRINLQPERLEIIAS